jgi:putative hemolysin
MISGVLRLGDRAVRALMVPRGDVDWLDATAGPEEIRAALLESRHSRLPVGEGSQDAIIGVVTVRDVLASLVQGQALNLRAHVREAPVMPDTADALDVLDVLREATVPMALVHDEYGHFEGLVTPADLGEVIVGAFRSNAMPGDEPAAVRREDGSWLLAGWMPADEAAERLGLRLPARRDYQTLAGLVLSTMARLPQVGEAVEIQGWRFEVVDRDALRIDKVLAAPITANTPATARRTGRGPTQAR